MTTMPQEEATEEEEEELVAAGEELLFGLDFAALKASGIEVADEGPDEPAVVKLDSSGSLEGIDQANHHRIHRHQILKELCFSFEDSLPKATPEDFEELFRWATSEGAFLEGIACRRDAFGGRGLFATAPAAPTTPLAVLPRHLRWGQSFAARGSHHKHSSTLEGIIPPNTPDLTALTLLVLRLCQQGHIYARCLPRDNEFLNAMMLSVETIRAWENALDQWDKAVGPPLTVDLTQYLQSIRKVRSLAEGCRSYVKDVLVGETNMEEEDFTPTFHWAMAMVKSRSHAFGSKRGYWLTPVLDLANHSPTNPNAVLVAGAEGELLLQATAPIARDEEILIDYQVYEDHMLLATYGFSLASGPNQTPSQDATTTLSWTLQSPPLPPPSC